MSGLQLPTEGNIVLDAFNALYESTPIDSAELVAVYSRYFATAIEPLPGHRRVFERFSLADPTIRTVIKSTTSL